MAFYTDLSVEPRAAAGAGRDVHAHRADSVSFARKAGSADSRPADLNTNANTEQSLSLYLRRGWNGNPPEAFWNIEAEEYRAKVLADEQLLVSPSLWNMASRRRFEWVGDKATGAFVEVPHGA